MDEFAPPADRRLFARKRMLKSGRVVFNRAASTLDCTMRNYSDGGARLDVESVLGIPDTFELRLDGHPGRPCQVVWRRGQSIGVAFTAF